MGTTGQGRECPPFLLRTIYSMHLQTEKRPELPSGLNSRISHRVKREDFKNVCVHPDPGPKYGPSEKRTFASWLKSVRGKHLRAG